jgi:hypothetical protein
MARQSGQRQPATSIRLNESIAGEARSPAMLYPFVFVQVLTQNHDARLQELHEPSRRFPK